MEIDSIEENGRNTVLIESLTPENPLPTKSGISGDPEILPRVGEQFQAEIPQLLTRFEYLKLSNDKYQSREQEHITKTGSIPLIWISEEEPEKNKDECVQWSEGHRLVPGLSGGVWSELEESGFVLGLYAFGKSLYKVKRFVGSKEMGDVLAFYYGEFLGSDRYKRWSECRKMQHKKCIFGSKIFTGSRHQEFLSRLLVGVSEESRNTLMEMFTAFREGKLILEDYLIGIKVKLGLKPIIEAVSIGRGKKDLTGNHSLRRESPAEKTLVALSPAEIMSVLTGDSRLSKAKANDLFWDSVWPRLLARGWHSEQPSSATQGLVYIAPGIDTFSRFELVRGVDFLDSVSDVLDLVASKPELLEIDDVVVAAGDEECRRSYLRPPPTPVRGSRLTVVDTSVGNDRELRCLPVKAPEENYENGDDIKKDDGLKALEAAPPEGPKRRGKGRRESPSDGSALLALPAYPVSSGAKARRRRKGSLPQSSRHVSFIYDIDPNDKVSLSSSSGSSEAVDLDADVAAEAEAEGEEGQHPTVEIDEVVVVGSTEDGVVKEVKMSSLLLPPPPEEVVPFVGPAAGEVEKSSVPAVSLGPADMEVEKSWVPAVAAGPADMEVEKSSVAAVAGGAKEGSVGPTAEEEGGGWAGPPRRRQGTRNRPLTTRVLEAFAYGFMDAKHNNGAGNKKKRQRASSSSESSRRARLKESVGPAPNPDPATLALESTMQNGGGGDVANKFGQ